MIDAKELRIGNYVHYKDFYPIVTWVGEDGCGLNVGLIPTIMNNGRFEYKNVSPIPLTPEILVDACGFKNSEHWQDSWFFNDVVGINIHLGKIYYNDLRKTVEMKSVHQLQNLYYALTGEELPIDINKMQKQLL